MKKDDNLERAFDEYFGTVEKPEGLAEDAKKLNNKRRPLFARFTKYASAFACALIVCIVAAVGIYSGVSYIVDEDGGSAASDGNNYSGNNGSADGTDADDGTDGSSGANSGSSAASYPYDTYSLNDLEQSALDAYSASDTDSALKLIEKFAYASNSQVTDCTGYSENGEIMLVKAEVTVSAVYNQQTVIYVEFTDDGYVCEDLTYYYGGESCSYGNITYLYYETEDNGEPVRCITAKVNEARYYIRVTSTDTQAYLNYLELLYNM